MMMQALAVFGLWIVGTRADCPKTESDGSNPVAEKMFELSLEVEDLEVKDWCTDGDWCNMIWPNTPDGTVYSWTNSMCGCYGQRCWKWCGSGFFLDYKWCYMRNQGTCSHDSMCYANPVSYVHTGCEANKCGVGRIEITEDWVLHFDEIHIAIFAVVCALLVGGLCLIRNRNKVFSGEYEPLIDDQVAA